MPLSCPLLVTWPETQACALDWESNWRPFGLYTRAQSTEPHQPGQELFFNIRIALSFSSDCRHWWKKWKSPTVMLLRCNHCIFLYKVFESYIFNACYKLGITSSLIAFSNSDLNPYRFPDKLLLLLFESILFWKEAENLPFSCSVTCIC